ncbi:hypothetical protein [Pseudomonas sp. Gutcm_11s]|uniref:hypothetical protein n=1 Tax=Pseudomonas sp. Gutcm_11s TaxID=3026088 RepID=UPI0023607367|nr:hypothetical protein [Pseudomonas sp. Gutcm_11s]MDD0842758.1 hypothetical protein [Pseudomonas sp. Gutcm_11s]
METLRAVLATLLFLAGIACLVHGLSGGPLGLCLLGMTLCFLFAYWLWPRGSREESPWFDVLELLIELPINAVLWLLRGIGRLFRDVDGVDL